MLGFELKYWLVLPWQLPVGLCGGQSRVMQLVGTTSSQKATVSESINPGDTCRFYCVSAGRGRLH